MINIDALLLSIEETEELRNYRNEIFRIYRMSDIDTRFSMYQRLIIRAAHTIGLKLTEEQTRMYQVKIESEFKKHGLRDT